MRRVAIANNWRDTHIHIIIVAYLKRTAADYYKEIQNAIT